MITNNLGKRLGKFRYTINFMEDDGMNLLQQIYAQVIPISVIYDTDTEIFEVIGACMQFEPLEPNEVIPSYTCIINKTPFGHTFRFEMDEEETV